MFSRFAPCRILLCLNTGREYLSRLLHLYLKLNQFPVPEKQLWIIWKHPDNKVHGANMGPTLVLSAPDGPHVGPMNLAIRVRLKHILKTKIQCTRKAHQTRVHTSWGIPLFRPKTCQGMHTIVPDYTKKHPRSSMDIYCYKIRYRWHRSKGPMA